MLKNMECVKCYVWVRHTSDPPSTDGKHILFVLGPVWPSLARFQTFVIGNVDAPRIFSFDKPFCLLLGFSSSTVPKHCFCTHGQRRSQISDVYTHQNGHIANLQIPWSVQHIARFQLEKERAQGL